MNPGSTRGIAVVDIGATNSKVVLFDRNLREIAYRKSETLHRQGPPYKHLDHQRIVEFLGVALNELDALLPVDVIAVSAFGATLACVDGSGDLAMPVMDYLAEPPSEIVDGYARIAPPFSEVFCNIAPVSLTLGKQLYWLETSFPNEFANILAIMPWGQYLSFRLGGRETTEISALGVFSQLLDVLGGEFSSLVKARRWEKLFAPLARAWDVIGELRQELLGPAFRGRGQILCGIHDSNANYLRYLAAGLGPFALLSTGTMIIGFESQTELPSLDPEKDTFSFTDIYGRPVGCCRFFGGREFETLLAGAPAGAASLAEVEGLVAKRVFALPSFSDTGGPVPGSGNRGRIEGPLDEAPSQRASLATLYAALMVSELLNALGSTSDIIVDGPFARNDLFCELLAGMRSEQRVFSSLLQEATAAGAAVLALIGDAGALPRLPLELKEHRPAAIAGIAAYRTLWHSKARAI
ncbi:MAG: FGGY family carbohydrate kinase [Roseiarcus sp.]